MAMPNVVLEGFMGTGKSTVGPLLAARLQYDFVDTDEMVEQDAGLTIKEIFERYGEAVFRALEKDACLRAARRHFTVIATGGGALLDPESRAALEATSVAVLLTCERGILLSRLEESARMGERPMLAENFEARVNELLHIREELYSSLPLKVDTTNFTPEEVAAEILALYEIHARQRMEATAQ